MQPPPPGSHPVPDARRPEPDDTRRLADGLKAAAAAEGFAPVGITTVDPPATLPRFLEWLAAGHHGTLSFLAESVAARADPRSLLPEARSLVCMGYPYWPDPQPPAAADELLGLRRDPPPPPPAFGLPRTRVSDSGAVAAYARGRDYHRVLMRKAIRVCGELDRLAGRHVITRCCIDIHPLMERDFAVRAGLGWIGKNTNLLHPTLGSYLFLVEILCELPLPADPPFAADHCGSCTACLDACPTRAFPEPRVLDSRRCISYLTIERTGPLAEEERRMLGPHVYGCDICQDVCPYNRRTALTPEPELRRPQAEVRTVAGLAELLVLDEAGFLARFAGSPLMRARRQGVLRNAAVALGNLGDPAALPALDAAAGDPDPVIAEAAAWAAGRIRGGIPGGAGGAGAGLPGHE